MLLIHFIAFHYNETALLYNLPVHRSLFWYCIVIQRITEKCRNIRIIYRIFIVHIQGAISFILIRKYERKKFTIVI